MTASVEIQIIAVVTGLACALPGVFLVLRRMALMSDAISHSILPGIVIAFFITKNLHSPLLVIGAGATGVLTVVLVEALNRTRLLGKDAAIGLVFPALFSIGVILITKFAGNVHLDTDAVLLGELAFATFDRISVAGYDIGPRVLWVMFAMLATNTLFVGLFFKELKISTFDRALAATLGLAPAALHYGLMTLVSLTAVTAFDAVGSVLVVGLMIVPAAAAYLLTNRLRNMVAMAMAIAAMGAITGYWTARSLDASIAGCIASALGFLYALCWMFAPEQGLLALAMRRRRQRWSFAEKMLAIHLLQHEGLPEAESENRVEHLGEHLRWGKSFAQQIVRRCERYGWLNVNNGGLELTSTGRTAAQEAMIR